MRDVAQKKQRSVYFSWSRTFFPRGGTRARTSGLGRGTIAAFYRPPNSLRMDSRHMGSIHNDRLTQRQRHSSAGTFREGKKKVIHI